MILRDISKLCNCNKINEYQGRSQDFRDGWAKEQQHMRSARKFWNRKSHPLIKSRVHGFLIVPRPFTTHISRAHACHGKIWSIFARLRLKFKKVFLRWKTA